MSAPAPVRGAYLVDTVAVPGGDAYAVAVWIGRVQRVRPDGGLVLISHSGYEWPVESDETRPATHAERQAYDRRGGVGRAPRAEAAVS